MTCLPTLVAAAKRHHTRKRLTVPFLAPAVASGGKVLANGSVALPLHDGTVAVYAATPVTLVSSWRFSREAQFKPESAIRIAAE